MEDQVYNILWIDDEHEKLSSIKRAAVDFNVKFHPFKSLVGGMEELEKNSALYDGVLLDAKFYEREDDVAGTEDTGNSIAAKERIDKLGKSFDIHVLTGQAEAFGSSMYKTVFKKVFRKGVDEDEDALFESLRESASNQINNQIKFQFKDVFSVCNEKFLGKDIEVKLLNIAKPLLKNSEEEFNTEHLIAMRKVIERLIKKLSELNLIPSDIANNKGWMNGSSRFISNIHGDFKQNEEYFHPFIAHLFHRLLDTLQDGAHGEGTLRLKVDDYLRSSNNFYAVKSCAYQLFELIVWVQLFIEKHPNKENNAKLWHPTTSLQSNDLSSDLVGKIAQDSQGNYYCNMYILDYRYTESYFKIGDEIKITDIGPNLSSNSNKYYKEKALKYSKI